MLEFFRWLVETFRSLLFPVYVVPEPWRAVRYTFGRAGKVLEPGWYLACPFFQEIRTTNCAEDCLDLANMPLTTWDGEQVTVSYNVRFRIADVLKYQTRLRDADASLHAEASCEVALRIRRRMWSKIYRSQGRIERRISTTLTRRLADWGIEVVGSGITVCTRSKPISWIRVD